MRKNAKLIISPDGIRFKRGQKVCSFGDVTTWGYIEEWDIDEECWKIKRSDGDGYNWWEEDEPVSFD
jgi:hypothetical protein